MKFSPILSASVALLLSILPAMAGEHFTRMVESKPVVANGLEFVAAVQDEWVCFNAPIGTDPVEVQLLIHNVTDKPLIFSTLDTFGVIIKDLEGNKVRWEGGRNGTMRSKSVIINAGQTYCLSRKGELRWGPGGNTRIFNYDDGTGMESEFGPFGVGSFTLSFRCQHEERKPVKRDIVTWTGEVNTNEARFKVVNP